MSTRNSPATIVTNDVGHFFGTKTSADEAFDNAIIELESDENGVTKIGFFNIVKIIQLNSVNRMSNEK